MLTLLIHAFKWFTLLEVIGGYWWILQMSMALAALFSIIVAAGMAYKMMVKLEPLDIMNEFCRYAAIVCSLWVIAVRLST